MIRISGIYRIQSILKPERVYVGSSVNILKRWKYHKEGLIKNKHHSKKLQRHFNKYGIEDLGFEILEDGNYINKTHLFSREQVWYSKFEYRNTEIPYFNSEKIAGSIKFRKPRKSSIEKGAKKRRGKPSPLKGKPTGRTPWNKGLTKETNDVLNRIAKKMSESQKGKTAWNKGLTKETNDGVRAISEKKKGIFVSEETRKKQSDAKIGRKNSPETRRKISEANMGRIVSQETIDKIVAKHKGIPLPKWSDERKKNQSQKITDWWALKKKNNGNLSHE
jgi:group I intron endonuclease